MQRFCRVLVVFAVAIMMAMTSGCGGDSKKKKGKKTTLSAKKSERAEEGYDYQVFAPLPKIMTEPELPLLVDDMGTVETACFEKLPLESQMAVNASKILKENAKELNRIIRKWVVDDIGPSSVTPSMADSWEITVENPLAMGVDTDDMKFVEGQECIDNETGWLSSGVRVVTTVFGTRQFKFETDKPLSVDEQDNMKETVEEAGYVIKSEALELYRPALDEDGEQKKTDDGELMYKGPAGISVPESKLPPESERGMKEWTIEAEKPMYFAYQELPNDAWSRENKKKKCDVFLVWGDVTPHAPECDELKSVTFAAEKSEKEGDESINVEIESGDIRKKLTLTLETTERLELGNRLILWINAKKDPEGEGVWIRTNSVKVGGTKY